MRSSCPAGSLSWPVLRGRESSGLGIIEPSHCLPLSTGCRALLPVANYVKPSTDTASSRSTADSTSKIIEFTYIAITLGIASLAMARRWYCTSIRRVETRQRYQIRYQMASQWTVVGWEQVSADAVLDPI